MIARSEKRLRRRPRQVRAQLTVEAIQQAAAELFCDIGYDRSSTNRIAERAGVSIGSLYQYFDSKESILAALLESHQRAVHAVVDDGLRALEDPEVPLAHGLTAVLTRLVELHTANPELTRVLTEEVPKLARRPTDDDEAERYAARLAGVLRRRTPIAPADLQSAALLVVTTVEGLTRWLSHGAPSTIDRHAFIREAVAMLTGYLGTQ